MTRNHHITWRRVRRHGRRPHHVPSHNPFAPHTWECETQPPTSSTHATQLTSAAHEPPHPGRRSISYPILSYSYPHPGRNPILAASALTASLRAGPPGRVAGLYAFRPCTTRDLPGGVRRHRWRPYHKQINCEPFSLQTTHCEASACKSHPRCCCCRKLSTRFSHPKAIPDRRPPGRRS